MEAYDTLRVNINTLKADLKAMMQKLSDTSRSEIPEIIRRLTGSEGITYPIYPDEVFRPLAVRSAVFTDWTYFRLIRSPADSPLFLPTNRRTPTNPLAPTGCSMHSDYWLLLLRKPLSPPG